MVACTPEEKPVVTGELLRRARRSDCHQPQSSVWISEDGREKANVGFLVGVFAFAFFQISTPGPFLAGFQWWEARGCMGDVSNLTIKCMYTRISYIIREYAV